jgi:hypothetical protein
LIAKTTRHCSCFRTPLCTAQYTFDLSSLELELKSTSSAGTPLANNYAAKRQIKIIINEKENQMSNQNIEPTESQDILVESEILAYHPRNLSAVPMNLAEILGEIEASNS